MQHEDEDYQKKKDLLKALIEINQVMVKEQYRLLKLKGHNQTKVKLIDPKDQNFYYLN